MGKRSIYVMLSAAGIMVIFSTITLTRSARATSLYQETEKYCLSCHSDPNKSITLPSGELLSVYIDASALHQGVHSQTGIECEACHTNITTYPHPPIQYQPTETFH